jgi:hypothetical protein
LDVKRTRRVGVFDWDRYEENNLASLLKGKKNAAREQAFG